MKTIYLQNLIPHFQTPNSVLSLSHRGPGDRAELELVDLDAVAERRLQCRLLVLVNVASVNVEIG